MSNRIVHVEIHADDPEAAIRFYERLFGWSFQRWEGQEYWLFQSGTKEHAGIGGGLLPRRGAGPAEGQPVNAWVCTVEVTDLDRMMASAADLGGSIALAKMPIPGMGWLGYVKDPSGNILGMMQPDPAAA